jgi:hypothetical protein
MSRWQVTLRDPLNTLPPLVLSHYRGEGGYDRARVSQKVDRHNAAGRPVVVGPSYGYRYLWTLGLLLTEDKSLLLERYERVQAERGYLVFDDETDYLTPEPAPHSRSLLAGTTKTIADSVTGFGRFAVWIYFPEDGAPQHLGMVGSVPWKGMTLLVHEIPGVAP